MRWLQDPALLDRLVAESPSAVHGDEAQFRRGETWSIRQNYAGAEQATLALGSVVNTLHRLGQIKSAAPLNKGLAQLRAADSAGFPGQAYFTQQHASGLLVSAEDTAARILRYLARPDFGAEPVADIRTV